MVMVYINGQMEAFIKEIGTKIRLAGMANTTGTMVEIIKGTGLKIICMDKASTLGLMDVSMKANT